MVQRIGLFFPLFLGACSGATRLSEPRTASAPVHAGEVALAAHGAHAVAAPSDRAPGAHGAHAVAAPSDRALGARDLSSELGREPDSDQVFVDNATLAISQYREFIARAGEMEEYKAAVKRSKEQIEALEASIAFVKEGMAQRTRK